MQLSFCFLKRELNLSADMLKLLMPEMTIVSWTAGIDGLAMHRRGEEAVSGFDCMRNSALDEIIGVLHACGHTGLVNEVRNYSNSIRQPKIGCMVDLLAHTGLVQEVLEFVKLMPIEPNLYRCACKVLDKLELGEKIAKYLIDKELVHSSN